MEKPFGRDPASARALSHAIHEVFAESDGFRIDHFLRKEVVQKLLYFRFAHAFPEPLGNRTIVAGVEITMAERFSVEGRGEFYEEVGAIRDVVRNHMLQVVANFAMEPPVGAGQEALRVERVEGGDVELFMLDEAGEEMQPYERLLDDALRGDATLFTRQDAVEAARRVVDPVLDGRPPPRTYRGGSWGRAEAGAVAGRARRHNPRPPAR